MKRTLAKRIGDFLIYIAIALALACVAIWLAGRAEIDSNAFIKWGGLVANTLVLFGSNAVSHRRLLRRSKFWVVLSASLVVHLAIFLALFIIIEHWSLFWFIVAYPIENAALDRVLNSNREVA